jgi:uncharacterized membrane protein YbaN (DUF454 family)
MLAASARLFWLSAGWLGVLLGGIGIVVPGWPTTVFFIVAAACFSRSSPRFERWVLGLPGIGPLVADYRAGGGMPFRIKALALGMMWLAIGVSAGLLIPVPAARVVVVALGLVGTWFIVWRVPTSERVAA